MPAANIQICLAIEDAVHPALYKHLGSFGVMASIPLGKEDLPDISVIPLFSLGASKGGHIHKLPTGGWEYDLFGPCALTIELSVPRFSKEPVVIAGVYSQFGQQLARIREALRYNQGAALNALLPFHKLTHLIPAGTQLGFSEERGEDIATINYVCDAGILPTAWPVA
jgi:hypothetical protein